MGDSKYLLSIFAHAGAPGSTVATMEGTVRFPSIRDWVHADAAGWLQHDADDHEKLLHAAEDALKSFLTPEGTVAFTMSGHIATARQL